MEFKVLKTEDEHRVALHEAERLVALDPPATSPEGERLQLLALLVEDYERRNYAFADLDPIDVIEHRMAEQSLRQKDLVPMLGSRSRVSEVLSRKRPLTVQMIRALSAGLGIPADALVGRDVAGTAEHSDEISEIDWGRFPYVEMEKRGWFESARVTGSTPEDRVRSFLAQVVPSQAALTLFRRRFMGSKLDDKAYYATLAWTSRVLIRAKERAVELPKFEPSMLSADSLRDLGRLSWFNNGPELAVEFLAKCGIVVIVEPRLSNAVFDGAAMLSEQRTPVIGLTLRIDRIDYFWFTLMHEVVHVWKHLTASDRAFIDRVEHMGTDEKTEIAESEANKLARDSFIKRAVWERSATRLAPTRENIQSLADALHIHPAIIAGRIQFETGKYEVFRDFLGQGTIQNRFS
jgi:HTH-type transcriptional regulator/antitoxin HigA